MLSAFLKKAEEKGKKCRAAQLQADKDLLAAAEAMMRTGRTKRGVMKRPAAADHVAAEAKDKKAAEADKKEAAQPGEKEEDAEEEGENEEEEEEDEEKGCR